ncbi:hypothetical protein BDV28DRAFT_63047 [Aspergillus coremiiformis]|uniref:Uncharacterized protein n=1 Tax=Aspergillus coremiiformis TaxID=138285 RepID=A0A5N6YV31_9EURO|nr:hypothetical protein BDV28DRAFT_63047 [Aspergillus coremiiformis]
MPTDPDGDSQMASSPESSHMHSEDSPVGSRTPTNNAHNATSQFPGTSELSPPGSQAQSVSADVGGMALGNSSMPGSFEETTSTQQQPQPGVSWMNKRAEEEYHRAMEYLVDQDFNLDEFGDPFDDRDMEEKLF